MFLKRRPEQSSNRVVYRDLRRRRKRLADGARPIRRQKVLAGPRGEIPLPVRSLLPLRHISPGQVYLDCAIKLCSKYCYKPKKTVAFVCETLATHVWESWGEMKHRLDVALMFDMNEVRTLIQIRNFDDMMKWMVWSKRMTAQDPVPCMVPTISHRLVKGAINGVMGHTPSTIYGSIQLWTEFYMDGSNLETEK